MLLSKYPSLESRLTLRDTDTTFYESNIPFYMTREEKGRKYSENNKKPFNEVKRKPLTVSTSASKASHNTKG